MDSTLRTLLDLLTTGGPAVFAAVFAMLYWLERKRAGELTLRIGKLEDELMSIATTSTQAVTKLEGAFSGIKDMLIQVLSRI